MMKKKKVEKVENGTLMKRYQFWGRDGIQWTPWFKSMSNTQEPTQLKNLKNEYKYEGDSNDTRP